MTQIVFIKNDIQGSKDLSVTLEKGAVNGWTVVNTSEVPAGNSLAIEIEETDRLVVTARKK